MKTNWGRWEKKALIQRRMAIQPDANWNISPPHRSTTPVWEAAVDTLSSNSDVNTNFNQIGLAHLGGIVSLRETPRQ